MRKCRNVVASGGQNSSKARKISLLRGLSQPRQMEMFKMIVDIHKHICARRLKCRRGGESRRGKYRCEDPSIRRHLYVKMKALLRSGRGQSWAAQKTIEYFKERNRDPKINYQSLVRYYRAHQQRWHGAN